MPDSLHASLALPLRMGQHSYIAFLASAYSTPPSQRLGVDIPAPLQTTLHPEILESDEPTDWISPSLYRPLDQPRIGSSLGPTRPIQLEGIGPAHAPPCSGTFQGAVELVPPLREPLASSRAPPSFGAKCAPPPVKSPPPSLSLVLSQRAARPSLPTYKGAAGGAPHPGKTRWLHPEMPGVLRRRLLHPRTSSGSIPRSQTERGITSPDHSAGNSMG
jgi:hypothetical protein